LVRRYSKICQNEFQPEEIVVGKHANSAAYREFERLDRQLQEESFEAPQPLTDDELEQIQGDAYWNQLDATAGELAEARRGCARANCRVDLWDETRRAA
jgi:hypothetical protein